METCSVQVDVSLFSGLWDGPLLPTICLLHESKVHPVPPKEFPGPELTGHPSCLPAPSSIRPSSDTQQSLHPGSQGQQAWEWTTFSTSALLRPGTRPQLCPPPGLLPPPTSLSIWSRDGLRASLLFLLPRSPVEPWPARWTPTHRQDAGPVVGEGMAQLGSKTTTPQPKADGTAHPGPTQLRQM